VTGQSKDIRIRILERVLLIVFWGHLYLCGKIFGDCLKTGLKFSLP